MVHSEYLQQLIFFFSFPEAGHFILFACETYHDRKLKFSRNTRTPQDLDNFFLKYYVNMSFTNFNFCFYFVEIWYFFWNLFSQNMQFYPINYYIRVARLFILYWEKRITYIYLYIWLRCQKSDAAILRRSCTICKLLRHLERATYETSTKCNMTYAIIMIWCSKMNCQKCKQTKKKQHTTIYTRSIETRSNCQ